ncbi:MAG: hypothetical protein PVSMB7_10010 [Chloroflexota bacterium]
MHRFTLAVTAYVLLCCAVTAIIVIRGDGPHPRLASIYPFNGDRFFPGGPVQLTFTASMDQTSVERALQVSPGTQGQGQWYGTTLNLQPVGDWKPNITYRVQLLGSVVDTEGRPLHTPVSFWFRVHHVGHLVLCPVQRTRTVCERTATGDRPLFIPPTPIREFSLSPDGSTIAYTRTDRSRLPHLFLINADGTQNIQLTFGTGYADSRPYWSIGDAASVNYNRQRVTVHGGGARYGPARLWNIGTDGANNGPV